MASDSSLIESDPLYALSVVIVRFLSEEVEFTRTRLQWLEEYHDRCEELLCDVETAYDHTRVVAEGE
jgi:hypothetical protein